MKHVLILSLVIIIGCNNNKNGENAARSASVIINDPVKEPDEVNLG